MLSIKSKIAQLQHAIESEREELSRVDGVCLLSYNAISQEIERLQSEIERLQKQLE